MRAYSSPPVTSSQLWGNAFLCRVDHLLSSRLSGDRAEALIVMWHLHNTQHDVRWTYIHLSPGRKTWRWYFTFELLSSLIVLHASSCNKYFCLRHHQSLVTSLFWLTRFPAKGVAEDRSASKPFIARRNGCSIHFYSGMHQSLAARHCGKEKHWTGYTRQGVQAQFFTPHHLGL